MSIKQVFDYKFRGNSKNSSSVSHDSGVESASDKEIISTNSFDQIDKDETIKTIYFQMIIRDLGTEISKEEFQEMYTNDNDFRNCT